MKLVIVSLCSGSREEDKGGRTIFYASKSKVVACAEGLTGLDRHIDGVYVGGVSKGAAAGYLARAAQVLPGAY